MNKKTVSRADAAYARVREIALAFPAAEEKLSHGAPSFRVRGKMFLTFVDDHHGDGRVAVWCKSSHDEQRRLVAADPGRFFVPPYVGVKGWLGIRVDVPEADWIELAILVEEGWRSIAPPRIVRGEAVPARKPVPPPSRVTTDPKVAHAALARLADLCLALPEAVRDGESRYATFRVRKRVFAYFFDGHHGDGIIGACVKEDKPAIVTLLRKHPEGFFVPAYIGARGWLGIRLEPARVDWKDVARRVAASYRRVAPKSLR